MYNLNSEGGIAKQLFGAPLRLIHAIPSFGRLSFILIAYERHNSRAAVGSFARAMWTYVVEVGTAVVK